MGLESLANKPWYFMKSSLFHPCRFQQFYQVATRRFHSGALSVALQDSRKCAKAVFLYYQAVVLSNALRAAPYHDMDVRVVETIGPRVGV